MSASMADLIQTPKVSCPKASGSGGQILAVQSADHSEEC